MKTAFVMLALAFGLNCFADGTGLQYISTICNLSDLSKADNPNIQTKSFDIEVGKTVEFATYNGHTYKISADDLSDDNSMRFQLTITSRDAKTDDVIGSASAMFSKEVPDLCYQEGPNLVLNCMQK